MSIALALVICLSDKEMSTRNTPTWFRLNLRFRCSTPIVLLIAVGCFIGALLTIVVRVSFEQRRVHERQRCLTTAILVLQNYDDIYARVPPIVFRNELGEPLGSWRFGTLRYLPEPRSDVDLRQAWNTPVNATLAAIPIYPYCFMTHRSGPERLWTNIVAVHGPGTAFDESTQLRFRDLPGDLIVLVELRDSGVHWMAPGDLDVRDVTAKVTQGVDGSGLNVAFNDQDIWYLDESVPVDVLRGFCTVEGARRLDRDKLLMPYRRHWERKGDGGRL